MYNNNGNTSISYNNFLEMPRIPYKIVEKLATDTNSSAENLWKILKYATTKPLDEDNLTFSEKMALLWTPDKVDSSQENLFRVFLKPLVSSSLNDADEQIQLKIFRNDSVPNNSNMAMLTYRFDLITQEACCHVYDEDGFLVERTDMMEAYLLDCLNGSDNGIGSSFLEFNRMMSSSSKSIISINNSKSIYGRSFLMGLRYMNPKSGGGCQ